MKSVVFSDHFFLNYFLKKYLTKTKTRCIIKENQQGDMIMTRYEMLMTLSDKCMRKALELKDKDIDLCVFYRNASEGLRSKALSLPLGE